MKKYLVLFAASLMMGAALAGEHLPEVEAEVRRIDRDAGKVTLRHGNIPNLDMPPMTMVFQVQDPALLDNVKAGDKVQVRIDQIDGAYTLLSLEPAQ